MTTRSRARRVPAAASIALAGAMLAVSAAPVAAAAPTIRIQSVSSESVQSGESVRVRFQATNNNQRTEKVFVAVSGGLRCTAGCSTARDIRPGRSQSFDATVVAPEVRPGEQSGLNLAVSVRIGTQTAFDHKMILVSGADKPSSAVSRVSGRVRDADGKPIGGVSLTVRDSAGHDYRATSTRSGKFSIRSSGSRPIAAGPITVVAAKDGYRTARSTVQGTAGAAATVRLTLAAVAAPSTTPPSPAATSAPPVTEEPATEEALAAVSPPATARTSGDDGSGLLLYTILGGLLIAAGLGTLALMLIRRRSNPDTPMAAPYGAGGGGMADAPTAVLRTVPTQDDYQQRGYR
ncbi:carboxypeptidase regulatory-like domain-containing protein [Actinoplanes sp. NPDC049599]|uniref:carboxypeptidase-like regulatory domain-containing protein n=1 Tax=Actinoplanes sp. NPDC049599 TaxID=3363903 RepID=UPI0037A51D5B